MHVDGPIEFEADHGAAFLSPARNFSEGRQQVIDLHQCWEQELVLVLTQAGDCPGSLANGLRSLSMRTLGTAPITYGVECSYHHAGSTPDWLARKDLEAKIGLCVGAARDRCRLQRYHLNCTLGSSCIGGPADRDISGWAFLKSWIDFGGGGSSYRNDLACCSTMLQTSCSIWDCTPLRL